MTTGPRLQVEPVQTADSSKTLYAVFDEQTGSVAIDYSPYYERIATALETIASNTTTMKNLSQGAGINFKGPYEWLSMSSLYRLYRDQNVDISKLKQDFEASVPKDF